MKEYNGHRSYNAWNISLWIHNEEWIYRLAQETKDNFPKSCAKLVLEQLKIDYGNKTPDGVKWTLLNVRKALEDI